MGILGIGLTDKALSDLEKTIIKEVEPCAIVLFGRNIADPKQLSDLVREVKSIAKRPPMLMIDEEGGRVDRLRHLIPGLPSAELFGEGNQSVELSTWMGKVIGAALRYFDIEVDLAPVVDVRGPQAPKGLERRTFGADPETVIDLAGAFMRGLHSAGTGSCLKHFPGIGIGSADPHYGATVIDISLDALVQRDLVPYARLGNESGAIMIGHGTYPQIDEPDLPATLSRRIAFDLLRQVAGFEGLAITDDMEMHAVSDFGSYEDISERAVLAGNDVVMFASHIERVPDIHRFLEARTRTDAILRSRVNEAAQRAAQYRQYVDHFRREAPPATSFEAVAEEVKRFVEAFEKTRGPHEVYVSEAEQRKKPRGGRTGREEWT
ncbi:MAG TPA: glycoside hydrolase family 3 N-terminal domain-containing protein [Thermoanaerobaculia bacterium]|nr:glycoside hydrolase family 3 N-terminal domain-containing protein [Thermoanaerobaculia bacterium]